MVPGTFQLPLTFSNRPATDPVAVLPFVHLRIAGADLPIALLADALAPALLRVVPAGCLTTWPPGATIDVTVDAGLPDAFGVGMASAATATFAVASGGAPPSCPDGGAGD